jgi:hypothetical protein
VADKPAKDIAKELHDKLKLLSSTIDEATAQTEISTILSSHHANNPTDKSNITAELQTLYAAGATGACYYQSGGKTVCNDTFTAEDCALKGGTFFLGQSCMLNIYNALKAEGL